VPSPLAEFPPDLATRFEPLDLLGAGGMGLVFLARDRALDRRVALKLLRWGQSELATDRFQREASLLAGLEHPGVVRVYDHGTCAAGPYLVMELLEGHTLHHEPCQETARRALAQIADALEVIHARGLLHRDVKPPNILCTPGGRGVLVDFGLAHDPERARLTPTGQVVGTLVYMAPALLRGEPQSPGGDWYGWAASAFLVLEGRPPRSSAELLPWIAGTGDLGPLEFRQLPDGHPARACLEDLLDPERTQPPGPAAAGALLDALEPPRTSSSSPARRRRARSRKRASPTVTAGAPEVPPRRRDRRGVLLPLACLLLAGLALLPGLPRAPRPTPATDPPPDLRARAEALDTQVEELLQGHPEVAARGDDTCPAPRILAAGSVALDPRNPLRLRRVLQALEAWRRALPAEVLAGEVRKAMPDPAALGRAQLFLSRQLPHLFRDLEEVIEVPAVLPGGWSVTRVQDALRTRDDYRQVLLEELAHERWLGEEVAPLLAPAAAVTVLYTERGVEDALIPQLLARLEASPRHPRPRAHLYQAFGLVARHAMHRGRLACAQARPSMARSFRALGEVPIPPGDRRNVADATLQNLEALRDQCPGRPWWRDAQGALPLLEPGDGPVLELAAWRERQQVYQDRLLAVLAPHPEPEAQGLARALEEAFGRRAGGAPSPHDPRPSIH